MLLRAFLWQLLWFLTLRIVPFALLRRYLGLLNARGPARVLVPGERIPWALRASGRYLPRPACLVQAVAAQILYSRNGIPTDLQVGVRKRKGKLKAHAWIERNGEVVVGRIAGLERYARLYTITGGGRSPSQPALAPPRS